MNNIYSIFFCTFIFSSDVVIPCTQLDVLTIIQICLSMGFAEIPKLVENYSTKNAALKALNNYQSYLTVRPNYGNYNEYEFNLYWIAAMPDNSQIFDRAIKPFVSARMPWANVTEYLRLDYQITIDLNDHFIPAKNFCDFLLGFQRIYDLLHSYYEDYGLIITININSKDLDQDIIFDSKKPFESLHFAYDKESIKVETDYNISFKCVNQKLPLVTLYDVKYLCEELMNYMYGIGHGSIYVLYKNQSILKYHLEEDQLFHDQLMSPIDDIFVDPISDSNLFKFM